MSEPEYLRYQFFEILKQMYAEGFHEGRNHRSVLNDSQRFSSLKPHTTLPVIKKSAIENHAIELAPVIRNIRITGARTLQEIADKLTNMNIKTISGQDRWHPSTVRRLETILIKFKIEFYS